MNQINLMNLYNQLKSDFIAAKPPSLAFTMTFCLKLVIVTVILLLLDLSAVFNTVDVDILLKRLVSRFSGTAPMTGFARTLQTAHNLR